MRAPSGRGETRSRVPHPPRAAAPHRRRHRRDRLARHRAALADPAELSSVHRATYTSLLRAIDAGPAYEIADTGLRATMFAEVYADADDAFRATADSALDALEAFPAGASFSALDPGDAYAQ